MNHSYLLARTLYSATTLNSPLVPRAMKSNEHMSVAAPQDMIRISLSSGVGVFSGNAEAINAAAHISPPAVMNKVEQITPAARRMCVEMSFALS